MSSYTVVEAASKIKTFRQQLRKAVSTSVRLALLPGAKKAQGLFTQMSTPGRKIWGKQGKRVKTARNDGSFTKSSGFKSEVPYVGGFWQKWQRGVVGDGGVLEAKYAVGGMAALIERGGFTRRMHNPRFRGKPGHYMSGVKIPIHGRHIMEREWNAASPRVAPAIEAALEKFRRDMGL